MGAHGMRDVDALSDSDRETAELERPSNRRALDVDSLSDAEPASSSAAPGVVRQEPCRGQRHRLGPLSLEQVRSHVARVLGGQCKCARQKRQRQRPGCSIDSRKESNCFVQFREELDALALLQHKLRSLQKIDADREAP